ncbi:MAG: CO dehydrogenase maturation factor [Synergistales bacterium 54_9]|jgi:CO dehydrogenase maturation factor|nr:MAG: CO dehydrogenase maturation factor [Synergistales bacterium 54_9]
MCRILLCGRGGSGKSTIAALLARYLAVNGRSVCVIDADESNESLSRMLGVPAPEMTLADEFGGREAISKWAECKNREESESFCELFGEKRELHVRDLPGTCVGGRDNLCLISIGKIRRPKEGCACPFGVLGRHLIESLHEGNWIYIIDTDAGTEHIGRGLHECCDVFFPVLDLSFESVLFSRFINKIAEEQCKPCFSILNKAAREELGKIGESISAGRIGDFVVFPNLPGVAEANLFGCPVPLEPDVLPMLERMEALFGAVRTR